MGANWLDDYLREWPTTTCAECGETCIGCEDAIKLGEKRDDVDTRKVMHGACYKKRMPTFEEWKQQASMTCLLCRQSCDGSEDVVTLALGHAMHDTCYKRWLDRLDSDNIVRRARRAADLPGVVLPGEEGLSREQVARRRNAELFRRQRQSAAPSVPKNVVCPSPTSSCNEGASEVAEGDDSLQSIPHS